jgi:hypothetical protein
MNTCDIKDCKGLAYKCKRAYSFGVLVDPTFSLCKEHFDKLKDRVPDDEAEMWKLFDKWRTDGAEKALSSETSH